ncbi:CTD small phosphatase-like protein 2 [Smittium culicis]|uniref:CTD small phosphatase-like protein 2 n=1 Tax=Smittium culicis TaxID=133412 RepID=A0A1R1XVG4_9FUNG|nr:CTD small phosphatase-like protein 2 [Smittium culicis]
MILRSKKASSSSLFPDPLLRSVRLRPKRLQPTDSLTIPLKNSTSSKKIIHRSHKNKILSTATSNKTPDPIGQNINKLNKTTQRFQKKQKNSENSTNHPNSSSTSNFNTHSSHTHNRRESHRNKSLSSKASSSKEPKVTKSNTPIQTVKTSSKPINGKLNISSPSFQKTTNFPNPKLPPRPNFSLLSPVSKRKYNDTFITSTPQLPKRKYNNRGLFTKISDTSSTTHNNILLPHNIHNQNKSAGLVNVQVIIDKSKDLKLSEYQCFPSSLQTVPSTKVYSHLPTRNSKISLTPLKAIFSPAFNATRKVSDNSFDSFNASRLSEISETSPIKFSFSDLDSKFPSLNDALPLEEFDLSVDSSIINESSSIDMLRNISLNVDDIDKHSMSSSSNYEILSSTIDAISTSITESHQSISHSDSESCISTDLSQPDVLTPADLSITSTISNVSVASTATTASNCSSNNSDFDIFDFDPYGFMAVIPPVPVEYLNRPFALPPKHHKEHPITLVLDLDETLVHCSVTEIPNPDFTFPVVFNGVAYEVYCRTRPFLKYFLEKVSTQFEVVVFTASQQIYADNLLDRLDPSRSFIKHRLFRDSCVYVGDNYVKDLSVLGRDLSSTVIVDNAPQAFAYQQSNGIPIESWYEDKSDSELLKLLGFLESLKNLDDVRPVVESSFRTKERVIFAKFGCYDGVDLSQIPDIFADNSTNGDISLKTLFKLKNDLYAPPSLPPIIDSHKNALPLNTFS